MSSDLLDAFGTAQARHQPIQPEAGTRLLTRSECDDGDDEDFGDFEDVEQVNESGAPICIDPTAHSRGGFVEQEDNWGDYVNHSVLFDAEKEEAQSSAKSEPPESESESVEALDSNDEWEPITFISQDPLVPSQVAQKADTTGEVIPQETVKNDITQADKVDIGPPPMNVPPPSVLLIFIASFFQTLPSELKKSLPSAPLISDSSLELGAESTLNLKQQMATMTASARIIAGRKLRWKRDTILSQSMKIGPAGKGGMKLSSLDKTEVRREDQELAEVMQVWRRNVGFVKSTIAKLNAHAKNLDLIVPEISEAMPVRSGKGDEGAMTAAKCCFLCGVYREERIAKLDISVEDSFGEWWTDHWGHVDCVIFWQECKDRLPQR